MAELRALLVDWGGVLTSPLQDTMSAWCDGDGIDYSEFRRVMKDWLGTTYGAEAVVNPIHALERGEVEVPDFERELAGRLRTRDGGSVAADGLLARMFAGFSDTSDRRVQDAVRRTRVAGLRTALLSNSWGNRYPREGWDELFDTVVISGEVGMRKPEPRIYRLTADRLGVAPQECVFVDDLAPNVRAAEALGMVGIVHVTPQETVDRLEALFGLSLPNA